MKGLVVAGGKAQRMQADKKLLDYHGMPQWQYVYQMLSRFCTKVYVSLAEEDINIDVPCLIDHEAFKNIGPIAALCTAFTFDTSEPWFVVACDYPLMREQEFRLLYQAFQQTKQTVVFKHQQSNFFESYLGIYTPDFFQQAEPLIHQGEYGLQAIFKHIPVYAVYAEADFLITSVDTPQQMQHAKSQLKLQQAVSKIKVTQYIAGQVEHKDDFVGVEDPLEISIQYFENGDWQKRVVAVTMRTPGDDELLALGFLLAEQVIKSYDDVLEIKAVGISSIVVTLKKGVSINLSNTERNFYTTSSCGVCGKASIEAVRLKFEYNDFKHLELTYEDVQKYLHLLNERQGVFAQTGGVHASALFDAQQNCIAIYEDVGRHNALDKVIGFAAKHHLCPLTQYTLLVSGRASFELIQKAIAGGITRVLAIGAPSSLAVQLADEYGLQLYGFVKPTKFTRYA